MLKLLKEFWVNSYKSDPTAFYFEVVSVAFTVCGSCILTFTSPHPIMTIVFPLYWVGSSTMLYAGIRRRQIIILMQEVNIDQLQVKHFKRSPVQRQKNSLKSKE
jgi:hypothetical protein